jgi:hypothetical protein
MNNLLKTARTMLDNRGQIVGFYGTGQAMVEVAAALAVPVRARGQWLAWHRSGGDAAQADKPVSRTAKGPTPLPPTRADLYR